MQINVYKPKIISILNLHSIASSSNEERISFSEEELGSKGEQCSFKCKL